MASHLIGLLASSLSQLRPETDDGRTIYGTKSPP